MAVGKEYYVYIMTNAHNTVLYTGVTNNLTRRVYEHKSGIGSVFTRKYNIRKLVYYEVGNDANTAIAREKQIKGGSRQKKIDLINSMNPEWKDLYEEYCDGMSLRGRAERRRSNPKPSASLRTLVEQPRVLRSVSRPSEAVFSKPEIASPLRVSQ
jgi:putative endonuclease